MQKSGRYEFGRIITIPNALSLVRILLIPVIVWFYCVKKDHLTACTVLTLSGITDIADGIIARKFNMTSDLGKILDPIADKLTQLTVLSCLLTKHELMLLPIAVLILKELSDIFTGYLAFRRVGIVFGAEWHGKAAATVLYFMIFLHIIWIDPPEALSSASILACTLITAASAVMYGIRNIKSILA